MRPRPAGVRGRVRPLERRDVPRVAELHLASFDSGRSARDVATFLANVLFDHPWRDDALPSLAYEDETGRLVGCLGVMPRPMEFRDRPLRAIVTHNFMVAPDVRGLAAVELLRAAMTLGAEVSFSETNVAGRRVSEALGSRVLSSRSLRWFRPLRPCALAGHVLSRRLPSRLVGPVDRLARRMDTLMAPASKVASPGSPGRTAPLDAERFAELSDRFSARFALRPVYDAEALAWLLASLRASRREQMLRARVVRNGGRDLGWFLYYSRPDGVGRVIQMGAAESAQRLVLTSLFEDAKRDGNVAVTGAFDPAWADDLGRSWCFLGASDTWHMTHGAPPAIRDALETGDAFFGRLEGEGWLRFAF